MVHVAEALVAGSVFLSIMVGAGKSEDLPTRDPEDKSELALMTSPFPKPSQLL